MGEAPGSFADRTRFAYQNKGSVTLEAAILLPVMAAFMLGLIALIRISAAENALQTAASEAVKQIAAGMYPVYVMYTEWSGSEGGQQVLDWAEKVRRAREALHAGEEWSKEVASYLPEPLVGLLPSLFEGAANMDEAVRQQAQHRLNTLMTGMIREEYIPQYAAILNADEVTVTQVTLPDFSNKAESFFALELQYVFHIRLPFFEKDLILKKAAAERVWIGT